MNRYVIARISASSADILEIGEVDRHAFFRICFHMARSVPKPRRRPVSSSSRQAVQL